MVLANSQKKILLTLKVIWYMRKNIKLDIAIKYVCIWLFFVVSTFKERKTFVFSGFVGISFANAFNRRKLD